MGMGITYLKYQFNNTIRTKYKISHNIITVGDKYVIEILNNTKKFSAILEINNEDCLKQENPIYSRPCTEPSHYHLDSNESFKVLKGKLGILIDENTYIYLTKENETYVIEKLKPHTIFSASSETLIVNFQFDSPKKNKENLYKQLSGILRDNNNKMRTLD
jgi:mannose-6-phosphate isomerase-like protein (cupin superfamily)